MAKKTKKNSELPGIEGPGVSPIHIDELEELAAKYVKERDKRLVLTPREVEAKRELGNAMRKYEKDLRQPDGRLVYRFDEQEIIVEAGKDKVRVAHVRITEHEE
jgi:NAD(P)H-hydrate repair Nnr-like enzyme with NAD(P)H-hydrate dehydratase domain